MNLPQRLDLPQMQTALAELSERIERFEKANVDINGRRWMNCGDARDGGDYVTLRQLLRLGVAGEPGPAGADGAPGTTAPASWPILDDLTIVRKVDEFIGGRAMPNSLMTAGSNGKKGWGLGDLGWSILTTKHDGTNGTGFADTGDDLDTLGELNKHPGVLQLGVNPAGGTTTDSCTIFLAGRDEEMGTVFNPIHGSWEIYNHVKFGFDGTWSSSLSGAQVGLALERSIPPRAFVHGGEGYMDSIGATANFGLFTDTDRTYFNTTYGASITNNGHLYFINWFKVGNPVVIDTGVQVVDLSTNPWVILKMSMSAGSTNLHFQVFNEFGVDLSGDLSTPITTTLFDETGTRNRVGPYVSMIARTITDKLLIDAFGYQHDGIRSA